MDHVDDEGVSLVQLALKEKKYSAFGLLLSLGTTLSQSDVDGVDDEGKTFLMKSSEAGADKSVLEALIQGGADIEKKDNIGMDSLMLASTRGRLDVVSYLITEKGAVWAGR